MFATPLGRILLSAFLFDGSYYVVVTVLPLKAVALGASSFELGLMPVLSSGSYILAALLGGRLADRWPRIVMARWGAGLRAGITLLLLPARSVADLFLVIPLLGIVNGLFWPGLQAGLATRVRAPELPNLLSRFNVAWSAGKMCGFLVGGVLVERSGYLAPVCLAALAGGAPLFLLPREASGAAPAGLESTATAGDVASVAPQPAEAAGVAPQPAEAAGVAPQPAEPERSASAWRLVGWTANFLLFGVGATLNFHYPKLLDSRGLGGEAFGVFLGLTYLVQTIAFLWLGRWGGWHFRARWLIGAQLVAAGALMLLPAIESPSLAWSLAPALGLGLGLAYSSSLYYSLRVPAGHGRSTGFHEAILASGAFLLPFLGGLAVRATGLLVVPYLLGAGIVLGGVLLQLLWLRPRRRS